ncbi:dynein axonemal heavy chain 11 [Gracilinanus agilis]|uniref:dynein axonemal heavy chain 11 n=1 Tax=Gracilinanus agilis TaxID=191870 RepID=UPI001CFD487C|nr:dynein axonemal heavy chain 11 [Gracilinanus agilis]
MELELALALEHEEKEETVAVAAAEEEEEEEEEEAAAKRLLRFSRDPRTRFLGCRLGQMLRVREETWSQYLEGEENRQTLQEFWGRQGPGLLLFRGAPAGRLSAWSAWSQVAVPILSNKKNHTVWPYFVSQDLGSHVEGMKSKMHILNGVMSGRTLLPIPTVAGNIHVDELFCIIFGITVAVSRQDSHERTVLHTIESVVIKWSHQIQKVLQKDSGQLLLKGIHSDPETELDFWKTRRDNLLCIYDQLQAPVVQKMVQILKTKQSSYFPTFEDIFLHVEAALFEAQDIELYLRPLRRHIQGLKETEFPQTSFLISPLFHTICLIWSHSTFYNSPARMIILLQEFCNLFLDQAVTYLSPDELMKGEVEESLERVQVAISVLKTFKNSFFSYREELARYFTRRQEVRPWDFQSHMVFWRFDKFFNRLMKLEDIFSTMLELEKLERLEFGGTKGTVLNDQICEMREEFGEIHKVFQQRTYDPCDYDNMVRLFLEGPDGVLLYEKYIEMLHLLDQFGDGIYAEWKRTVDEICDFNLKQPLIKHDVTSGLLSVNFDPKLVAVLREVKYLLMLEKSDIPDSALAIYGKRNIYLKYIGSLELLVQWYNKLKLSLLEVEQPLIEEELKAIDAQLREAEQSFTWQREDSWDSMEKVKADVFELQQRVEQTQENVKLIQQIMKTWTEHTLFSRRDHRREAFFSLEGKGDVFARKYRLIQEDGRRIHRLVEDNLRLFKAEAASDTWKIYLEFIDDIVVDGFFNAIMHDLEFFLVNTEKCLKSAPFFQAQMILMAPEIIFKPPLEREAGDGLYDLVEEILCNIFRMSSQMKRVALHLDIPNYQIDMDHMPDLTETRKEIMGRVSAVIGKVLDYRNSLDAYSYLWVDDRAEFMKQFLLYSHPLTAEEMDIQANEGLPEQPPTIEQFKEQIDIYEALYVQMSRFEDFKVFENWFKVDMKPFKMSLLSMIKKWSWMFQEHLLRFVTESLTDLEEFIKVTNAGFCRELKEGDYNGLVEIMGHLMAVKNRQGATDELFDPLKATITLLESYGQKMPDHVYILLEELPERWNTTKKNAVAMRHEVAPLQNAEVTVIRRKCVLFDGKQVAFRERFRRKAPFCFNADKPYEVLDEANEELEALEEEMLQMQESTSLFEVALPDFKQIKQCRREIRLLKGLWDLIIYIQRSIDNWTKTQWRQINVEQMDGELRRFAKDIWSLDKDVRFWDAYLGLELTVKNLLASLRAVTELQNPAIRERHWHQLMEITGVKFSVNEGTVLADLLGLQLHKVDDEVRNIVDIAVKELGTEKELMFDTAKTKNVLEATGRPHLYEKLKDLQDRLILCEKALAEYLETKRLAFPRFYFVSSAHLLDILSNGNQPKRVTRHLTKLFDSIADLQFEDGQGPAASRAIAMYSKEREHVPFHAACECTGHVETWLQGLEETMQETVRCYITDATAAFEEKPREQWILDFPAQVALTSSQIWWTTDVGIAFSRLEEGYETALKDYNKKQVSQLNTLITMLLGELTPGDRQKIMTICTIDVHARDVVAKLVSQKVASSQAFAWLSQLRHRWDDTQKHCFVNICDAQFQYFYEYLGNGPRLVITPLTDRCYITLTQSLHLTMSGAPAGPAGTGKTETTKDLGHALGMMVYVFNCSEQMDYKSIGNVYKGLVQTGAWGCFDEFNRIAVEVLSVVAVQVKMIHDAIRNKKKRFMFLGEDIRLKPSVGIFITMNPGYAGRTELPENLKALFRPCAMVAPDIELICEIMLVAEGFVDARLLARKFIALYTLCQELLSKQDHYDWGLRAVKSVLVVAGSLRRGDKNRPEDQVLMRALRDFNLPKIVTDDIPVFMGLIGDLFPALDVPRKREMPFEQMVRQSTLELCLQPEESFILKVVQLEELLAVRHSVFVIGNAGTGKSKILRTLNRTYVNMKQKPVWNDLNPKAVTTDELFGFIHHATREWKDGLFSSLLREQANLLHSGPKWIVLDGDIDPMWIESLNTVMDDNKVLTLASNERVALTPHMRLLFEIHHLRTATPATVSRAGILYVNPQDLGWNPYVASWIDKRSHQSEKANLTVLFDKYVPPCLDKLRTSFKTITLIPENSLVQTLCSLLDCLLTPENVPSESPREVYEIYFIFACIWAFGGALLQDQLSDYPTEFSRWWLKQMKAVKFPSQGTIFDYYLDPKTRKFLPWADKVPKLTMDPDMPLQTLLVPTPETTRLRYFADLLLAKGKPFMLVGQAGVGKTLFVKDMLASLPGDYVVSDVPFNYYTTSAALQRILEAPLEKKAARAYGPAGNKKLVYFIDDMNMPEVDVYGSVQPHALIRQHVDYGHWYDRHKLTIKEIHHCQYVACMNPAVGSFTIDPRLQRHFSVFACNFPSVDSLATIYSQILGFHFQQQAFSPPFLLRGSAALVQAAIGLHHTMILHFLPTAVKFHYTFNLRDLSSVFQGILFATPECLKGPQDLVRLWLHESSRVYGDKLMDKKDCDLFQKKLLETARRYFEGTEESVLVQQPLLYCHFANGVGDPCYMPVKDWETLKAVLTETLDAYNELNAAMPLVFFEDAMQHVCRISRILHTAQGHCLLIGVGGSGKQSLSRLAAYICSFEVFQITLRKDYGLQDLKIDLTHLYIKTGAKNMPAVFLLTDAQVPDERFLVLINDLLASGEIPDLFSEEDMNKIIGGVRHEVRGLGLLDTRENCWKFFLARVRRQLKVVLCFSPVGHTLRGRARKFPALVNCSAIDWFHAWPQEALLSVSGRFIEETPGIEVTAIQAEVSQKQRECEADLAKAEPALVAAADALDTLNRVNLSELKAFPNPPIAVTNVTAAVMVLLAPRGRVPKDRSWKAAKIFMGKVDDFLQALINYDKEHIPENCLRVVHEQYLKNPEFNPNLIRTKSFAAAGLCAWVINIVRFYEVYCDVEPKRQALAQANLELEAATEKLQAIRKKLADLGDNLSCLTASFEKAIAEKVRCQDQVNQTSKTIGLANRLVRELESEKVRWGQAITSFEAQETTLCGDVLLTAAFVSYVGYFTKQYREELLQCKWIPFLKSQKIAIPITADLDVITMLTDDATVAAWNNEGLPSDRMSTENATILTHAERWPLMIDPQQQGIKWMKNKYGADLKVLRLGQKGFLNAIENALAFGDVTLIENLDETIDPVLDPLLGRNTIKRGKFIRIGDRECEFHPNFRLILHTKLANPHYKPELQAQTTLLNFTVTEDGLEAQLLADVVSVERPDLEKLKSVLTKQQNDFKIELKHLEDDLLLHLSTAEGSFLDDTELVEKLEITKSTAAEIELKVDEGKENEAKINEARDCYRPVAARAALLYFVINDLRKINPIYQFSLKAFNTLFHKAVRQSEKAEDPQERLSHLMESITYSVFLNTSQALFEKDKLTFLSQMTFQDTLESCSKDQEFKSILFSLCYFHACVAGRLKFGPQGWNRSYPFNPGDLTICANILYNYLEASAKVPWEDLRYLFGEIMYGGHITDDWDRRLCRSYLEEFMNPSMFEGELLLAPGFPAPLNLDYAGYHQYIEEMLPPESPVLYGLHPNAEIGFLTVTSNTLFRILLEMQPRNLLISEEMAQSSEEKVKTILDDILEKLPEEFDMAEMAHKSPARSPYVLVCFQECERMNLLLREIRASLQQLDLGLRGELTLSPDMEAQQAALKYDAVPDTWLRLAYPSTYGLAQWFSDLLVRCRELDTWTQDLVLPAVVWLPGFFNPQSFLTAVMQSAARKNQWPLDSMGLNVDVTKKSKDDYGHPPREGAYLHGLFMEGARWDVQAGSLAEARLMELAAPMPVLFVRAGPADRRDTQHTYECPVYRTRARGPTYVCTFGLRSRERAAKWVLAGAALLLAV